MISLAVFFFFRDGFEKRSMLSKRSAGKPKEKTAVKLIAQSSKPKAKAKSSPKERKNFHPSKGFQL